MSAPDKYCTCQALSRLCTLLPDKPHTYCHQRQCSPCRTCSSADIHCPHPRASSRGTDCSSGCPPATTVPRGTSGTSRCRSLHNSQSTSRPSSSSTPCDPAGCCTSRDRRSGTSTCPPCAHTRSCSSSSSETRCRTQTPRSPGTQRTPSSGLYLQKMYCSGIAHTPRSRSAS